jgi:predicted nucleic acid-binding protein
LALKGEIAEQRLTKAAVTALRPIYAHREDSDWHWLALARLTTLADASGARAIPWPRVHEFYAIVTHPRIFNPPTPRARAVAQIEAWMESPSLELLGESPAHWDSLRRLLADLDQTLWVKSLQWTQLTDPTCG